VITRLSQGVADLAAKLATGIAPETSTRFAMASTGMIAMLLNALSQDVERGVANRMTDIDEMKALFRGLDLGAADPVQAAARAAFCAREPMSLKLTDVEALHGEGMRLLIGLHAWAEECDDALNLRIWDFLVRHTERHRLDLPGMG
jgi:hypothetical protein